MKNILVPTDFSGSSVNAAVFAAQLTHTLKPSKILLMHCFEPVLIASEVPYPAPYYSGDLMESSLQKLNDLKSKLLNDINPVTLIEVITSDKPLTESIKGVIKIQNVDLVVIGSSEKGAMEKMLVGSSTRDIIKSSDAPVLVVPQKKISPAVNTIAFATDFKNNSIVPSDTIKSIVSAFDAKLFIVNVSEEGELDPDTILNQENFHRLWNSENAEYHYVTNKNIVKGIKAFVDEYQIQLLILIPQHHAFFEGIFHSSITKEFSFDNDIPVLFMKENTNANN
ncbi:universal stress protein [Pedobacter sp. P351]|uniref:universal stress protein n=1 Tax=Pedobacter superstes TaxID=3133441 RepID=UPI0030AB6183